MVAVDTRDLPLTPELKTYIAGVLAELDLIPADRGQKLGELASFVGRQSRTGQPAKLIFICTHNSRRSHMAQIWAQTAVHYYGITGVETFSGGTEATDFNPRAVAALRRAGFLIEGSGEGDNPVYRVSFGEGAVPMECFSKVFDTSPNPRQGFVAVMACSSADKECPLVLGAMARISIPFDDPKEFDGTAEEQLRYDQRCSQIAREMLWVFATAGAS